MESENSGYEQRQEKKPVMSGGEKYSAEPIIEKSIGELWVWLGEATRRIGEKRVTLPMRAERGKMLKEAKKIQRDSEIGSLERQTHQQKYVEHRVIEEEYVNQRDLAIETEWGKLEAKYIVLNEKAEGKPPLVIIPGASNGMESVDSFVRRLAERHLDRKVIAIGYPDAPSGKVTKDFCEAVRKDEGFGPHAKYFELAITKLYPRGDMDILGYSAGGGIAQEIDLQGRVLNMILVNAGGVKEMNEAEFNKGLVHENIKLLINFKNLLRYVFVDDKAKDEQKKMKFATWVELGKKCRTSVIDKLASGIRVKGKMVVVSGTEDRVTRAADVFNFNNLDKLRVKQPNLEVVLIDGSPHAGPFMEPDKYIDEMERLLG